MPIILLNVRVLEKAEWWNDAFCSFPRHSATFRSIPPFSAFPPFPGLAQCQWKWYVVERIVQFLSEYINTSLAHCLFG